MAITPHEDIELQSGENAGIPVFENYFSHVDDPNLDLPTSTNPHVVIYSYSGSGKLRGFWIDFNNENVFARLVIDGVEVFDIDVDIIHSTAVEEDAYQANIFNSFSYNRQRDVFSFNPPFPIAFSSSISIEARANNGDNGRDADRYGVEHTKDS